MSSRIRSSRMALALGATVAFVILAAPASAADNDPCKVLTAEQFSQIMGYTATINKTGSNQTSCFYEGPNHHRRTIHDPYRIGIRASSRCHAQQTWRYAHLPASGLIGGAYKQGTIIFSVSIRSTDQARLQELVAVVRRNLK